MNGETIYRTRNTNTLFIESLFRHSGSADVSDSTGYTEPVLAGYIRVSEVKTIGPLHGKNVEGTFGNNNCRGYECR